MKFLLPRVLIILVCLIFLGYTFYYTQPPAEWELASTLQILEVFLPILILATTLADLLLKYPPRSFIIGLGVMVMAVLQALKQLTPVIALEVILVSILSVRLFPVIKSKEFKNIKALGLSNEPKKSKLSKLRRHKK